MNGNGAPNMRMQSDYLTRYASFLAADAEREGQLSGKLDDSNVSIVRIRSLDSGLCGRIFSRKIV